LGNVRTDQIKRTAKELLRRFPDKFSADFEENKHTVSGLIQGSTTKIRNQIAGYITRYIASTEPDEEEEQEMEEPEEIQEIAEETAQPEPAQETTEEAEAPAEQTAETTEPEGKTK